MKNLLHNRWFRKLFRRRLLIMAMLFLQLLFLAYIILSGSKTSRIFSWILTGISILAALYIISKRDKGAYKLTWVFLMLCFPLFGGLLYLLFSFQAPTKKMALHLQQIQEKSQPWFFLPQKKHKEPTGIFSDPCKNFPLDTSVEHVPKHLSQIRYLQEFAGFPVYTNSATRFLTPGENMLETLKAELKKAKHYIFLEYFIVQEGVMWNEILEILKDKAAEGVCVRLIYDDMGCFLLLPQDYPEELKKYGIECAVFNPFRPFLTAKQNNRDHRKITVIDGKVAFTGGINLADEYINAIERFGHWKDAAIMVEGKAAWSFTLMFLQMWELCKNTNEDYLSFYPWKQESCYIPTDGLIQPYADSPMDSENVGEHVYLQIINNAKDYIYIYTPYLIVDDSMVSALTLAAKSGVDVRIITPHKWDKRVVHMTTRSYYRELIKSGIKIYEYSKGFLHAKAFVSDDTAATVGTTNLDFRSLYLHFECGTLMFNSNTVFEIKKDFLNTLSMCQQITLEDCRSHFFARLFQDILRLFAPLM